MKRGRGIMDYYIESGEPTQRECHPERSWARSVRPAESKDLRLLFGAQTISSLNAANQAAYGLVIL